MNCFLVVLTLVIDTPLLSLGDIPVRATAAVLGRHAVASLSTWLGQQNLLLLMGCSKSAAAAAAAHVLLRSLGS
jgi:hypothetical protein